MSALIEHSPTDMTATVDAGMTLSALQAALARGGQWLPIDPPSPDETTIGDILAHNLTGPRRFGYGTIRDYALGLKVRLVAGHTVKMGGKVVKNVAGYDLQKLFIGAGHTLGTILEATFKLRPMPEVERCVQKSCASLAEAEAAINAVLQSPITPVILDLHGVNGNNVAAVLGFDGPSEEVEWQLARARELGFVDESSLEYEKTFWKAPRETIQKISVLPSRLIETIPQNGDGPFVARAGNGVIYRQGAPSLAQDTLNLRLMQRAREAFTLPV